MIEIIHDNDKLTYDSSNKSFHIAERHIKFATRYSIKNPKTGASMAFDFVEASGPEFDKDTKWFYANPSGITLVVYNDPYLVKIRGKAYLKAKMKK